MAVDALHMLAFVDTEPADQLKWGQQALAIAQASSQPAAKKWEASLRNNIGYALYQLGRYEEALDQFKQAVVLREKGEDVQARRIAHWMVGWTLRALIAPMRRWKYNCGWSVSAKPPERRAGTCSRSWSCSIAPRAIESVPITTPSLRRRLTDRGIYPSIPMNNSETDKTFAGSIPKFYEQHLVPLILSLTRRAPGAAWPRESRLAS